MKCQQCDNPAVFHITELEAGSVREVHLCEEHARTYLNQAEEEAGESAKTAGKGGALSTPLGVGEIADDLAALDKRCCDMCGITFFEFRNQGRLGCPHDYVQFERELEPLIANIHGATEHTGRRPTRPGVGGEGTGGTDALSAVIGLRRDMREAISREDYEAAKEARDAIRGLEEAWMPGARGGPPSPSAEGQA
jgi:protein arginine kinase activator